MDRSPLNYEASDGDTHKQFTDVIPSKVVTCLRTGQFLHLATCSDNVPINSLMTYTYLPTSPYSTHPVIIMTTNQASRKTANIVANHNVSLNVHGWTPVRAPGPNRRPSITPMASALYQRNVEDMTGIGATIGGSAHLAPTGSEEEKFYIEEHLKNHSSGDVPEVSLQGTADERGSRHVIAGEQVRIIIVEIKDVRISDLDGNIQDWEIVPASNLTNGEH
jgi:hypothetical protein